MAATSSPVPQAMSATSITALHRQRGDRRPRLDDRLGPLGLVSGQLGYDRSERVGGVGAEDEVGEADLLPSPLDLLGGRRRVFRKYLQRVRRAKRSRVGVGNRQVWRDSVADHRHLLRELDVSDSAKSRTTRVISTRSSPGINAKATVSATSAATA